MLSSRSTKGSGTFVIDGVLAVLVILLVLRVRSLEQQVVALRAQLQRSADSFSGSTIRVGDRLATIRLLDDVGNEQLLDLRPAKERIFAVLDPRCQSCAEVAAEVSKAEPTLGAIELWVISLGDAQMTRGFARANHLSGHTYRLPSDTTPALRQKLSTFPQLFLIGGGGVVRRICTTVDDCVATARLTSTSSSPRRAL